MSLKCGQMCSVSIVREHESFLWMSSFYADKMSKTSLPV